MKSKIIVHIPHASTHIPNLKNYVVDSKTLECEVRKLTDWYTDELFETKTDCVVKADFSRLFCDVERFADDEQEEMSAFGMGALYEKCDDGSELRVVTREIRLAIMETYYWKHHQRLKQAVAAQLKDVGKAMILDCHSFSDKPLKRDLNQSSERPDFCIGTHDFHTPEAWVHMSKDFFAAKGFTLGINHPYSGTIVTMEYFEQNNNVQSMMLEVNKALYLKEGTNEKSERFSEIKNVLKEYIESLKGLQ